MKKNLTLSLVLLTCLWASAEEPFFLTQNTPNPFAGETTVYLTTADAGDVTLVPVVSGASSGNTVRLTTRMLCSA